MSKYEKALDEVLGRALVNANKQRECMYFIKKVK